MSLEDYRHICPRCLFKDMDIQAQAELKTYLDKIKEPDRADKAVYEERLSICVECEKFHAATCDACGCYVEFRAYARVSHCPLKKW